jgi:PAS domain-containing protein
MDRLETAWLELNARVDELSAVREQYLAFFQRAIPAYLVTDRQGVIEEANGAAIELLQPRRGELRRKPLALFVPLGQRSAFRACLSAAAAGNAPHIWRTTMRAGASPIEVDLKVRVAPRRLCWRLRTLR